MQFYLYNIPTPNKHVLHQAISLYIFVSKYDIHVMFFWCMHHMNMYKSWHLDPESSTQMGVKITHGFSTVWACTGGACSCLSLEAPSPLVGIFLPSGDNMPSAWMSGNNACTQEELRHGQNNHTCKHHGTVSTQYDLTISRIQVVGRSRLPYDMFWNLEKDCNRVLHTQHYFIYELDWPLIKLHRHSQPWAW